MELSPSFALSDWSPQYVVRDNQRIFFIGAISNTYRHNPHFEASLESTRLRGETLFRRLARLNLAVLFFGGGPANTARFFGHALCQSCRSVRRRSRVARSSADAEGFGSRADMRRRGFFQPLLSGPYD
jgi:hypothetical protein